jgi:hypothetical protein
MKKEGYLYKVKGDGDSWFLGNTFAVLIDDYRKDEKFGYNAGLFLGTLRCDSPKSQARQYGEIGWDEEVCGFEEFEEEPFGKIEFEE